MCVFGTYVQIIRTLWHAFEATSIEKSCIGKCFQHKG